MTVAGVRRYDTATMKRSPWFFALGLACLALPSAARADAAQAAAAQALFEEAKGLAAKEQFAAACPKFAESQKLDPAAGTLLHLGNCYEKVGKTASAWATFLDAAAAAKQQSRPEWEKLARSRASALEPKLSRLTVTVAATTAGLEVKRDGIVVAPASFGTALPVDPGEHSVEASAPGSTPFSTKVVVGPNADKKEVAVPALAAAPKAAADPNAGGKVTPPPPPPPPRTEDGDSGSGTKTIGLVVAGVGVAGLAVGGVTGLMAMSANDDAKKLCPNDGACASRDGVDKNDKAKTFALVSTVGFVAGGALLAGGAVLWLTAGLSKKGNVQIAPIVGATDGGLLVRGAW